MKGEKHIMKKIFLLVCMMLTFMTWNAEAAYNKKLDSWQDRIEIDLNGDGKKEIIDVYRGKVKINEKNVFKTNGDITLNDINKKYKYIELVDADPKKKTLKIHRYNGKKLNLYASAKLIKNLTGMGKKNCVYVSKYFNYVSEVSSTGNGKLAIGTSLLFSAAYAEEGYELAPEMFIIPVYTVKKNNISFSGEAKSENSSTMWGKETIIRKALRRFDAYKYPRVKSNKKMFSLKKYEKIKILKLKITSKYTYVQVKKLKTNQTGWIIFRTKDIDKKQNQSFFDKTEKEIFS